MAPIHTILTKYNAARRLLRVMNQLRRQHGNTGVLAFKRDGSYRWIESAAMAELKRGENAVWLGTKRTLNDVLHILY